MTDVTCLEVDLNAVSLEYGQCGLTWDECYRTVTAVFGAAFINELYGLPAVEMVDVHVSRNLRDQAKEVTFVPKSIDLKPITIPVETDMHLSVTVNDVLPAELIEVGKRRIELRLSNQSLWMKLDMGGLTLRMTSLVHLETFHLPMAIGDA